MASGSLADQVSQEQLLSARGDRARASEVGVLTCDYALLGMRLRAPGRQGRRVRPEPDPRAFRPGARAHLQRGPRRGHRRWPLLRSRRV
eukprot:14347618-Alexandrium_andersonii.AAC.1